MVCSLDALVSTDIQLTRKETLKGETGACFTPLFDMFHVSCWGVLNTSTTTVDAMVCHMSATAGMVLPYRMLLFCAVQNVFSCQQTHYLRSTGRSMISEFVLLRENPAW